MPDWTGLISVALVLFNDARLMALSLMCLSFLDKSITARVDRICGT
jgi:hypothetical protein